MFEPQDAREAYNRGLEYLDYNEPDQAIAAFTEAISLNVRYTHAFFARGCAWAERGDFDKAIADYDCALQLDPGYAEARVNRAEADSSRKALGGARTSSAGERNLARNFPRVA